MRFVFLTNEMIAQNALIVLRDGAVADLVHICRIFLTMIKILMSTLKTN